MEEIRKLRDRTFSSSLRAWHVTATKETLKLVHEFLSRCEAEMTYHPDFDKTPPKPQANQATAAQRLWPLNEEEQKKPMSLKYGCYRVATVGIRLTLI